MSHSWRAAWAAWSAASAFALACAVLHGAQRASQQGRHLVNYPPTSTLSAAWGRETLLHSWPRASACKFWGPCAHMGGGPPVCCLRPSFKGNKRQSKFCAAWCKAWFSKLPGSDLLLTLVSSLPCKPGRLELTAYEYGVHEFNFCGRIYVRIWLKRVCPVAGWIK